MLLVSGSELEVNKSKFYICVPKRKGWKLDQTRSKSKQDAETPTGVNHHQTPRGQPFNTEQKTTEIQLDALNSISSGAQQPDISQNALVVQLADTSLNLLNYNCPKQNHLKHS